MRDGSRELSSTVREVLSGGRCSVISCSRQALVERLDHGLLPQLSGRDQEYLALGARGQTANGARVRQQMVLPKCHAARPVGRVRVLDLRESGGSNLSRFPGTRAVWRLGCGETAERRILASAADPARLRGRCCPRISRTPQTRARTLRMRPALARARQPLARGENFCRCVGGLELALAVLASECLLALENGNDDRSDWF
jgi:hypothetical protein